ncbi:hypothetical protein PROFUN_16635, partial [Planoprotostelium fungivorum]
NELEQKAMEVSPVLATQPILARLFHGGLLDIIKSSSINHFPVGGFTTVAAAYKWAWEAERCITQFKPLTGSNHTNTNPTVAVVERPRTSTNNNHGPAHGTGGREDRNGGTKDLQRHKNLCLCLVSHFSDLSRQKIACLGLCLVLPFLSRKTKTSCRANQHYHIPSDVATTTLNTKCEPILNKSHDSMQQLLSLSRLDNFPQKVMRTISENFCRANQHYHIPSDVATTTLNTKCEPILNKSHDSMQVVAEMRQWIYFSGTWIEITDCYGGPPLHIRWAQLERESWMKIQWPSYDIPARFEMLQQR